MSLREWRFWAVPLIIFGIGLLAIESATAQMGSAFARQLLWRQGAWLVLSIIVAGLVMAAGIHRLMDLAYVLYGCALVLLVVVLLVGRVRGGAQRWLDLGPFSVQPAELVKVAYLLTVARYLAQHPPTGRDGHPMLVALVVTLVPMGLIVLQPDLGTALVLLPVVLAMLFVWGVRLRSLLGLLAIGLAGSPLFWHGLRAYQRERLLTFLDPHRDPLGSGYTIIQSQIAIGSGGWFGKGWLRGSQNYLNFLPERHTDFIFSVIGEEWGFLGGLVLLGLFGLIVWRGLDLVERTGETFTRLLATGIVTLMAFQVVINVGMTIGLVPVVGLPLPLVSYGGSSLMTTVLALLLLWALATERHRAGPRRV